MPRTELWFSPQENANLNGFSMKSLNLPILHRKVIIFYLERHSLGYLTFILTPMSTCGPPCRTRLYNNTCLCDFTRWLSMCLLGLIFWMCHFRFCHTSLYNSTYFRVVPIINDFKEVSIIARHLIYSILVDG